MSLGDGVDFDPNSVRQRERHELGKTRMQAHVYGKKKYVQVSGAENTEARQYEKRTCVYVKGKHKVKSKQFNMKE